MKKFKLLLVALISVLGLAFVGCESSDDAADSILGSWESVSEESYAGYTLESKITMTFNSNGEVVSEYSFVMYDILGDVYGEESDTEVATYTYANNLLTVLSDGESITLSAVVSGDTLTLSMMGDYGDESIVYTRVK